MKNQWNLTCSQKKGKKKKNKRKSSKTCLLHKSMSKSNGNTFSLLICTSDKGLNFFYSGISFFIYPNSHHMKNSPDSIIIYIFLLGHLSLSLTQKNSIIEIYKRGHCLYKHPQSKSKSKKFLLNSLTLLHTHITIFSSHFSFKILFNLFLFSS